MFYSGSNLRVATRQNLNFLAPEHTGKFYSTWPESVSRWAALCSCSSDVTVTSPMMVFHLVCVLPPGDSCVVLMLVAVTSCYHCYLAASTVVFGLLSPASYVPDEFRLRLRVLCLLRMLRIAISAGVISIVLRGALNPNPNALSPAFDERFDGVGPDLCGR